jgi:hypothetical protein
VTGPEDNASVYEQTGQPGSGMPASEPPPNEEPADEAPTDEPAPPADDAELLAALTDPATATTTAARVLERTAVDAKGFIDLEGQLRDLLGRIRTQPDVPADAEGLRLLHAALDAISYMLAFDGQRAMYDPQLEFADGTTVPIRLTAQPDETVARWLQLANAVEHPGWRSRLAHLVVLAERVATGRARVDMARLGVTAYVDVPIGWGEGMDTVDSLRAAASLARQLGLGALKPLVLRRAEAVARTELAQPRPAPGILLNLTQLLVDQRDAGPGVEELLDNCRRVYAHDAHLSDQVIELQISRARSDAEQSGQLRRERVTNWLDAADRSTGVIRAIHLEQAIQCAADAGDRALRQEATARLQQMTLADLELQSIRTSMIRRREQITAAVRPVTDADGWQQALDRFAVLGPPTGRAQENGEAVARTANSMSAIIPMRQFGGDGLLRFTATTDAERSDYRLAQHELFHLRFHAPLIVEALLRLPEHHGLPSLEELTGHFTRNPIVDLSLAGALARAFHRWWAGDAEGAGFTVAPRIESLARGLLLARNAPIYRLQREQAPGQYPGLGSLLGTLQDEGVVSEDWFRYLHVILSGATGLNLRNELSHGLLDDVDLMASALLLHCAAHLAIIPLLSDASPSR